MREQVASRWQAIVDIAPQAAARFASDPDWGPGIARILAGSEWVSRYLAAEPARLARLLDSAPDDPRPAGFFSNAIDAAIGTDPSDPLIMKALREVRNFEMARLTIRFLYGRANLAEVVATVSALARDAITSAIHYAAESLAASFGRAMISADESSQLIVLAMGKLGGNELNLSSDVDLIFCYPGNGETTGPRKRSFQEFFTRVGQQAIRLLETTTEDGFVFRVDMRLRPNGASGPLVLSFDAMEHYYQTHGRDWERYALIKADAIGGTPQQREDILARLRPFIYRRYLDYSAFDAIRDMRRMITRELSDSGLRNDVKRGAGGIRQIEFMIQTLQLVRGGRQPELQSNSLHTATDALRKSGLLAADVATNLLDSYGWLRNAEHYLQADQDRQTHSLPDDASGRAQLAFVAGEANEAAYFNNLDAARETVTSIFNGQFSVDEDEPSADSALIDRFEDREAVDALISGIEEQRYYRALTSDGRNKVDRLVPLLVAHAASTDSPTDTLHRWLHVLESIGRRTAYLALLIEEPVIRQRVNQLLAASPWFSQWLGRYPVLMDSLFNPPSTGQMLDRAAVKAMIDAEIDADTDLEVAMARLREIHHGAILHITSADLDDRLTTRQVGEALTHLAEGLVGACVDVAERDLGVTATTLGVIAYGRLGSEEMNYGSDLDLVFVFDDDGDSDHALTDQQKTRLVRRIIHVISTRTEAGHLYELDMRLRPNGRSGTLVTSWEGYRNYQLNDAWTWEHQALVRSRMVIGSPRLGEKFNALRANCLGRERDLAMLKDEVLSMRERMLVEHAKNRSDDDAVNVKTHRGAMIDVEFIVQFMVLGYANQHRALLDANHTQVLLQTIGDLELRNREQIEALSKGYALLTKIAARKALLDGVSIVSRTEIAATLKNITEVFNDTFGLDAEDSPK